MTLWWIRRDLRLADNQALGAALARGEPVVPVFVSDPALLASRLHRGAVRRIGFLHAGLRALDGALRERGVRVIVRTGTPAAVLSRLVAETGATAVVAERDVSPYARRRDAAVAKAVPLELVDGVSIRPPGEVLTADERPYMVFTPFSRAWLARPLPRRSDLVAAPRALPALPRDLASEDIPQGAAPDEFPSGEEQAHRALRAFTRGQRAPIAKYRSGRDRLDETGTSRLSPYLRFGMLSAREAAVAALEAGARTRAGAGTWLSELIWRDFYLAVLWHFPYVLERSFDASLGDVAWREVPEDLRAWQEGRTGYPVVDAAMRQLADTGWMHNRARMIVASFLVKDLLLDWRAGEAWFMQQLVDGDPAANNGGWQWTAGTGTDAAPYFRVFNPVLQAKRFDPDGTFVRRWCPELARVPARFIHEPWLLPGGEQRAAGVRIGRDYPAPIVDHGVARDRALAAYASGRGATASAPVVEDVVAERRPRRW